MWYSLMEGFMPLKNFHHVVQWTFYVKCQNEIGYILIMIFQHFIQHKMSCGEAFAQK